MGQLNSLEDLDSRNRSLSSFAWTDSTLEPEAKQAIEALLVEFNDIFARHPLENGINVEFIVQLTTLDNRLSLSPSLPARITFEDDILVELSLLHKYGIITTLSSGKYAGPIFAQRKPKGKLRLLVDLRILNTLITDDYINNNHPVRTLRDAAQHIAGKNLFCRLDSRRITAFKWLTWNQSISLH